MRGRGCRSRRRAHRRHRLRARAPGWRVASSEARSASRARWAGPLADRAAACAVRERSPSTAESIASGPGILARGPEPRPDGRATPTPGASSVRPGRRPGRPRGRGRRRPLAGRRGRERRQPRRAGGRRVDAAASAHGPTSRRSPRRTATRMLPAVRPRADAVRQITTRCRIESHGCGRGRARGRREGGQSMTATAYLARRRRLLERIEATQSEVIATAAETMADGVAKGGLVSLFGSGHSILPVMDAFPRYGSYPAFRPLTDVRLSWHNVLGTGGVRELLWLERDRGLHRQLPRQLPVRRRATRWSSTATAASTRPASTRRCTRRSVARPWSRDLGRQPGAEPGTPLLGQAAGRGRGRGHRQLLRAGRRRRGGRGLGPTGRGDLHARVVAITMALTAELATRAACSRRRRCRPSCPPTTRGSHPTTTTLSSRSIAGARRVDASTRGPAPDPWSAFHGSRRQPGANGVPSPDPQGRAASTWSASGCAPATTHSTPEWRYRNVAGSPLE